MDPAQDQNPQNQNTTGLSASQNIPTEISDSVPSAENPQNQTSQTTGIPQSPPPGLSQQTAYSTGEPAQDFSQPQTSEINQVVPASQQITSSSKFRFLIPLFLMLFFILATSGVLGGAYLVAYEKVKLTKYPEIQKKVAAIVMSIPFMPKTPKFLIAQSALAHQGVTKESFNISLALDSADFSKLLGLNKIDLEAKGSIDYSNPKDVKISLDASITKDFNIELRKKDQNLYFKINKLPILLLSAVGLKSDSFNPILAKWISYDTSSLNTEARKSMEDKEVDPLSEEYVDEAFQKYIDEKVLEKIKVEKGSEEGFNVYILSLDADPELVDYLGKLAEEQNQKKYGSTLYQGVENQTKLSDMVKSLKWKFYIDEKDYYLRKIIITTNLEVDNLGNYYGSLMTGTSTGVSQKSEVSASFAAKFGNFGEDVVIKTPQDVMSFQEFSDKISEIVMELYSSKFQASLSEPMLNPSEQFSNTRDAQRISDVHQIQMALGAYYIICEVYPENLEILTENESPDNCNPGQSLVILPKDPSDGSNYYYKTSNNRQAFDLCAKLENPTTLTSTCPNTVYNYHLQNP